MNTRKGKVKFKNFRILLDSEFSSKIVLGRLVKKTAPEKYSRMQCHTQAGDITNNLKVKVDFTLPTLSVTNVVTWKCHVDEYSRGGYDIIIGQDILT